MTNRKRVAKLNHLAATITFIGALFLLIGAAVRLNSTSIEVQDS